MSCVMKRQVLECYKALLKATNETFAGDVRILKAVKLEIKQEFEKNKFCDDKKQVKELLSNGWETEQFIRTCIAQGKVNDKGNLELRLPKDMPENSTFEPIDAKP